MWARGMTGNEKQPSGRLICCGLLFKERWMNDLNLSERNQNEENPDDVGGILESSRVN